MIEAPTQPIDQQSTIPTPTDDTTYSKQPIQTNKRTPLPKKQLTVVFIMMLCDFMSFTSITPYVNSMTADLLGIDKSSAGYYAGLLASSYYLSQFLCR